MQKYFYNNQLSEDILKKKVVHIFSHGDFDGICCAALFISAFVPKGITTYITDVNYDLEKGWSTYPFNRKEFNVVLDFKLSSDIDCWVDHHVTGKTPDRVLPKYHSFVETDPSAVHSLISLIKTYNDDYLKANKEVIGKFMYWARVIDSAQYDNADQIMKPRDSAILFDKAYQLLKGNYKYFVESLVDAQLCFDNLLKINPLFEACGKKMASLDWKCFFYAKEKGMCTDSGLIFLDLIESNVSFARYTPWKAFEDKYPKYCIACYKMQKDRYGISVSKNPFLKMFGDKIDLAKISETLGGGGHKNAAGINAVTKEEIYDKMQKLGEILEGELKNG
jgi:hypothetical protein